MKSPSKSAVTLALALATFAGVAFIAPALSARPAPAPLAPPAAVIATVDLEKAITQLTERGVRESELKGFADSYAMYDLLAKKIPAYGLVYPFLELALGVAFLTGFNPALTNWATIIIMGFSSIGVIQSVLDKKKIQCACLGAVFNLPMSTVTIIEDLLMVAMATYMIAIH